MNAHERSPEQVSADEQLTAAIEAVVEAYFPAEQLRMVGEYVVVMAVTEMSDGRAENGTMEVFRDGSIPSWKAMGLLASTQARLSLGMVGDG